MEEKFTEVPVTDEEDIDIVELKDDSGRLLKFYHIGTIGHKERWYAFFQPAEEIEGVEPEEVVIFEITGDDGNEVLAPIEDDALLDEVYEAFVAEMEDDCDCGCDDDCDCDGEHHCNCGGHHD